MKFDIWSCTLLTAKYDENRGERIAFMEKYLLFVIIISVE